MSHNKVAQMPQPRDVEMRRKDLETVRACQIALGQIYANNPNFARHLYDIYTRFGATPAHIYINIEPGITKVLLANMEFRVKHDSKALDYYVEEVTLIDSFVKQEPGEKRTVNFQLPGINLIALWDLSGQRMLRKMPRKLDEIFDERTQDFAFSERTVDFAMGQIKQIPVTSSLENGLIRLTYYFFHTEEHGIRYIDLDCKVMSITLEPTKMTVYTLDNSFPVNF